MRSLEISKVSTKTKTATVKVKLRSEGDEVAVMLGLKYDTNIFDFVKASLGATVPTGMTLTVNPKDDGIIELLVDGSTPFTKSSKLVDVFVVKFKIMTDAPKGVYPVEFGMIGNVKENMSNGMAEPLEFSTKTGSITVK